MQIKIIRKNSDLDLNLNIPDQEGEVDVAFGTKLTWKLSKITLLTVSGGDWILVNRYIHRFLNFF